MKSFKLGLTLILITFAALASAYALYTPDWQVPDEPAHYNYVRQVAENGRPPVIELGDWDAAYLGQLTAEKFPDHLALDAIEYEDHQPPLYYYLQAVIYRLSDGSLSAMRLFSVLIGVLVIGFTGLAAYQIFPNRPLLALAATGFVAFIPQHLTMIAAVNNDSLSELWIAIGIWLILKRLRNRNNTSQAQADNTHWAILGCVLGFAFLTKTTAYLLGPLVLVALVFERKSSATKRVLQYAITAFTPAAALGLLWWVRNIWVYGGLDFMGLRRHDEIVIGQLRTSELVAEIGPLALLQRLFQTTFNSFWGQFGWMAVPMPARYYQALWAFVILAGVGVVVFFIRRPRLNETQREILITLVLTSLIMLGLYGLYNISFVQHQGRYLFPALLPFGVFLTTGLWVWFKKDWVPLAALPGLIGLCGIALVRFVIPYL